MRLKRVRVFGFKTFADRTEVNLEGGVVAVVGPNGCGKSNLVDAILWGLGEGNARQLRTASSQDVIFNGSPKRKPVGFAEVQLLFDNEDGSLPIGTSEVLISRRLTRNGDSDYAINKKTCRLRDIYELLADSGLGRSGYAIVGQKEIDAALAASVEDRRAWVDEAAGVQRYRARKIESLKRLESAREHLERVDDILRELVAQRDPLKDEAEVAVRYKSLSSSLRDVELGLLVNELCGATRDVQTLEAKIEDSLRLVREELARADDLDEKAREIGAVISDVEQEMDAVRAVQQGSITAIERADAELRLANQRLESLDETEKSLLEDEAGQQERIREAEAEIAQLQDEERIESEGLTDLRAAVAGVGDASKSLVRDLRAIEAQLTQARVAAVRRLKAEAEEAHRKERRQLVRREIQGIVDALPELEQAVDEATQALHETTAKVDGWLEKVQVQGNCLAELATEEDQDAQSVRRALAERATLEGRRRGIEATIDTHEGLNQGSRAVLEAAEKGVLQAEYVPVAKAVEVSKDLALAIETALGGASNDLIVEDEQDAKAAIEWLKRQRAGRATFQPIPLMRPSAPSPEMRRLLGEKGIVGRASELVECEPRHQPVIDSILGRVMIVESLDQALRLAKTSGWSRMVTLDGEVLHSSGAVTGGQQSRQSYGLVQRKADVAELSAQLEALEKTIGQHESRSKARQKRREQVQADLAAAQESHRQAQKAQSEDRSYLQTLEDELKTANKTKEKLEQELGSLSTSTAAPEPEVDIAGIESQRDYLLKQIAGKSADAEQAEARLREAEARLQQARTRLDASRRRLNAAKESERSRANRLQNLEPDRQRMRQLIVRHTQERESATHRREEADARLIEAQNRRRSHLEESLRLTEEAKQARDNASSMGEGVHQAELNRARAEAKRANALTRLLEDHGVTEEEALEQEGLHEVPSDAVTVVNRLRREIRAMGEVNLGAIEAYDRLNHRVEELSHQRDDILGSIEQVEAVVDELDKLTRDRFLSTLEAVQIAFREQFQKLFGGGSGEIVLTDPTKVLESGIELDVVLPGKRRQPLNLLSGGERSLCASAFLFALLSVKPSPLVVLDEVDAPLDGRNVERFAEALFQFTDRTQFIVITHNESTIRAANIHLGVTMQQQDPGVSILVPVRLPEDAEAA